MKIINQTVILIKTIKKFNSNNIGFVPTMGALHNGHISLIQKSKTENRLTIVSIFINPTQFLANEDYDKYPKEKKDIDICRDLGVDILFMPDKNELYIDNDEILIKAPKIGGYILEGHKRAGHFDGMLRVVLKLLNITKPTNAYFGKKDAQQLLLIQKMTKELFLDINIIPCEIVRDSDGLALGSRNIYLSNTQRDQALNISKSLLLAQKMIDNGSIQVDDIIDKMRDIMIDIDIEYIYILKRDFSKIDKIIKDDTIILVACRFDKTRLIDNIWV